MTAVEFFFPFDARHRPRSRSGGSQLAERGSSRRAPQFFHRVKRGRPHRDAGFSADDLRIPLCRARDCSICAGRRTPASTRGELSRNAGPGPPSPRDCTGTAKPRPAPTGVPVSSVPETGNEVEHGGNFYNQAFKRDPGVKSRCSVSSDGFGSQPPVTSFITQPTWRSWRFDLARDLGENITRSCGRVIIDSSMMSIQILFPALLEPTANTGASVLVLTVCLGGASDRQAASGGLSNAPPVDLPSRRRGNTTSRSPCLGFTSMFAWN